MSSRSHGAAISPITLAILIPMIVMALATLPFAASTETTRTKAIEETWELEGDVYIEKDLIVPSDILLEIKPGTRMLFQSGAELKIYGHLKAQGTEAEPILFTSNRTTPGRSDWEGIGLYNGTGGDILSYCHISWSHYGVRLSGAENDTITHCTFYENDQGVTSYNAWDNSIAECTFINNSCAVEMELTADTLVQDCEMYGNNYGLVIKRLSRSNEFYNNTVSGCKFYPVYIQSDDSVQNTMINNDFMNNTNMPVDNSGNFFDSVKRGGNYWDNYPGVDDGGENGLAFDGIGDTDLPMARDYYPYMAPHGWERPPIQYFGQEEIVFSSSSFTLHWGSGKVPPFAPDRWSFALDISTKPDFSTRYQVLCDVPTRDLMGMEPGTYYVRAWAVSDDLISAEGDHLRLIVKEAPVSPTDLEVDPLPEGCGLNLTWTPPVQSDITAYHIMSNMSGEWKLIRTVQYPMTHCVIDKLDNGKHYFFAVTTEDSTGCQSDMDEVVEGVPVDSIPPEAVDDLEAAVTPEGIYLTWSPIQGAIYYRLEKSTHGPTEFSDLAHTTEISYFDKDVHRGYVYHYRVISIEASELESASGVVAAAMKPPPEITVDFSYSTIAMDEDSKYVLALDEVFLCDEPLMYEASFKDKDNHLDWSSDTDLVLLPDENVSGIQMELDLLAYCEGASSALTVQVYIRDVPDEPVITSFERIDGLNGNYAFEAEAYDSDLNETLTPVWYRDGEAVQEGGWRLELDLSEHPEGEVAITLSVFDTDGFEVVARDVIQVETQEVEPEPDPQDPVDTTPTPEPEENNTQNQTWLVLALGGLVLCGLAFALVVRFKRHRQR